MQQILQWILVLEVLGLVVLPLTWALFRTLPTKGILYARPLALLLVTMNVWVFPALQLIPYTLVLIVGVIGIIATVSWFAFGRQCLEELRRLRRADLTVLVVGEVIFLAAFLWHISVVTLNPNLYIAEKPMNVAFVQAIQHSQWFPPYDPWMAGYTINYYYLGHFVISLLAKITFVPVGVAFSLMSATLFALTAATLFAVVVDMVLLRSATASEQQSRRLYVIAGWCGVGAAFMALSTGNIVPLFRLLEEPGILASWLVAGETHWAVAPYYAHGSLSGLPWRSFVVNELHSSDIALPFLVLCCVWGLQHWQQVKQHRVFWVLAPVLLAGTALTSPWIAYPCLLLFALVYSYDLLQRRAFRSTILTGLATLGAMALFVAIFTRSYQAPPNLIAISLAPSHHMPPNIFIQQFGIKLIGILLLLALQLPSFKQRWLWGSWVSITLVTLLAANLNWISIAAALLVLVWALVVLVGVNHYLQQRELPFSLMLLFVAQTLDTLAFFIIIHDIENTFFKLGFSSWILASVAIFAELGRLWHTNRFINTRWSKLAIVTPLVAILFIGSWMPALAVANFTNRLEGWGLRMLDGVDFYFVATYPHEHSAVKWLQEHAEPGSVVLEATGPSFSRMARVATSTGLPTVMGWYPHQNLWRQGNPSALSEIDQRVSDINRMYQSTNIAEAQCLIQHYDVEYVFMGYMEREVFPSDDFRTDFEEFMTVAYPPNTQPRGDIFIYQRNRANDIACPSSEVAQSAERTDLP
ncbi:MAG: DUF2298 domain-containing protein [Chloroflexota bacterium]